MLLPGVAIGVGGGARLVAQFTKSGISIGIAHRAAGVGQVVAGGTGSIGLGVS